jgi:hypothetical protein
MYNKYKHIKESLDVIKKHTLDIHSDLWIVAMHNSETIDAQRKDIMTLRDENARLKAEVESYIKSLQAKANTGFITYEGKIYKITDWALNSSIDRGEIDTLDISCVLFKED